MSSSETKKEYRRPSMIKHTAITLLRLPYLVVKGLAEVAETLNLFRVKSKDEEKNRKDYRG